MEGACADSPQHAVHTAPRRVRGHIVDVECDQRLVPLAHDADAWLRVKQPAALVHEVQVQYVPRAAPLLLHAEQLADFQTYISLRSVDVRRAPGPDGLAILGHIAPEWRDGDIGVNLRGVVPLAHRADARLHVEGPTPAVRKLQEDHTVSARLLQRHTEDLAGLQLDLAFRPVDTRHRPDEQRLAVARIVAPEIALGLGEPMAVRRDALAHLADAGLPIKDPPSPISETEIQHAIVTHFFLGDGEHGARGQGLPCARSVNIGLSADHQRLAVAGVVSPF
mmetsp:Transcript_129867/g.376019  ORF Transcript_129867/g.376019 Transcript_129867/m.376019 type:complete len:279 (-) Transcript_129867:80-916(-)